MFWLKEVPPNTVIFCQLILLGALANQLTIGLQSAMQAYGNIKWYQTIVGSVIILNLPLAYVLLKFFSVDAYMVLVSYVLIELLACFLRMLFVKYKLGLSFYTYIKKVYLRELLPVLGCVLLNVVMISVFDFLYRFVVTAIISGFLYVALIYFLGLEPQERSLVKNSFNKIRDKIKGL